MKQIVVTAGIIHNSTQILIAQRKPDCKLAPNMWEFPGGKLELNETPKECLVREIKEELNLDIQDLKLFDVVSHNYNNEVNVVLIFFNATSKNSEFILKDCQNAKWIDRTQLKDFDFAPADISVVEKILEHG